MEKIIGWAVGAQLMATPDAEPAISGGKLCLSPTSIERGIEMHNAAQADKTPVNTSLKDVVTDNDFERRILGEVIPSSDVGVLFEDIGALDNVKTMLGEMVMLPLQRPCREPDGE